MKTFIELLISLAGILLIVQLSDLLILMIRYRYETDNWKWPIDLKRFREFCERVEKNKNE